MENLFRVAMSKRRQREEEVGSMTHYHKKNSENHLQEIRVGHQVLIIKY